MRECRDLATDDLAFFLCQYGADLDGFSVPSLSRDRKTTGSMDINDERPDQDKRDSGDA